MNTDPSLSIIIPARNVAGYLPASIGSIGPGPYEILVVDDGSTDDTPRVLQALAAEEPRLRVLQGPCKGVSAARNLAISQARAPLTAFLDADDNWRPGKLAAQMALHDAHPPLGFSFTDYRHVSPEGEDRGTCFEYWQGFAARHARAPMAFRLGGDALAQIYAENVVGTSTVMARTRLLRESQGFAAHLGNAEDWDLWLRLAAAAPVGCLKHVGTDYLMHRAGNLSNNARQRAQALREVAGCYRDVARAQDRGAVSRCEARLLTAEAEAASAAGQHWRAAARQCGAVLREPRRRAARQAAAMVLRALRAA